MKRGVPAHPRAARDRATHRLMDEPEAEPLFPRPMTPLAAILWTVGATVLYVSAAASLARGDAGLDTVMGGACETAAYLVVLFGILRAHAPDASIRAYTALRGTHALFIPLGLLLGVTLCALTTSAVRLLYGAFPDGKEGAVDAAILGASPAVRAAMFAVFVVVGPAIEELVFRGAIMQGLKKTQPLVNVVVLSAMLFGLAHIHWQLCLILSVAGLALGFVRVSSGSLVPTIIAHRGHNAMSFADVLRARARTGTSRKSKLLPLGALGLAGTLVLMWVTSLVARSHAAAEGARAADAWRSRERRALPARRRPHPVPCIRSARSPLPSRTACATPRAAPPNVSLFLGSSSGATVAASLAGGIAVSRIYRALLDPVDVFFPLERGHILHLDLDEWNRTIVTAGVALPGTCSRAWRRARARAPRGPRRTSSSSSSIDSPTRSRRGSFGSIATSGSSPSSSCGAACRTRSAPCRARSGSPRAISTRASASCSAPDAAEQVPVLGSRVRRVARAPDVLLAHARR